MARLILGFIIWLFKYSSQRRKVCAADLIILPSKTKQMSEHLFNISAQIPAKIAVSDDNGLAEQQTCISRDLRDTLLRYTRGVIERSNRSVPSYPSPCPITSRPSRSEEHTSELQSHSDLAC